MKTRTQTCGRLGFVFGPMPISLATKGPKKQGEFLDHDDMIEIVEHHGKPKRVRPGQD